MAQKGVVEEEQRREMRGFLGVEEKIWCRDRKKPQKRRLMGRRKFGK